VISSRKNPGGLVDGPYVEPVEKQGLLGGFEPPLRKIIGQLG